MSKFNLKPGAKLAVLAALLVLGVASAQSMPWAPPAGASAPEGPGAASAPGPGHHPHRPGRGPQPQRGGPGFEPMLDFVDASAEQREQVHKIMRASFEEGKAQQETLHKLHEQTFALLAAPTVDAAAIEALRVQAQAQQELLSKRMSEALVASANVLTPAQRAKLAEHMAKRPEGPEGRPERRKDGGPGRGQ